MDDIYQSFSFCNRKKYLSAGLFCVDLSWGNLKSCVMVISGDTIEKPNKCSVFPKNSI